MNQTLEGGLTGGTPIKPITGMKLVGIDQHSSVLIDSIEAYFVPLP